MGVVNTKATAITNADATPRVPNNSYIETGMVRSSVGTVEVAAADSDTSTFRFVRLPSNARLHSIKVYCDAITGGTVYDLGLYDIAAAGGAVISQNCYANDQDLSTAITVGTEVLFQAKDVANIEKRVWEDAGLSTDPFKEVDLVYTGSTVGTGAGTISLAVLWTL